MRSAHHIRASDAGPHSDARAARSAPTLRRDRSCAVGRIPGRQRASAARAPRRRDAELGVLWIASPGSRRAIRGPGRGDTNLADSKKPWKRGPTRAIINVRCSVTRIESSGRSRGPAEPASDQPRPAKRRGRRGRPSGRQDTYPGAIPQCC